MRPAIPARARAAVAASFPFLCLAALGLAASGCQTGKHAFNLNEAFSINVAEVNPEWPKAVEELPPAQREVFLKRGRPDYIHLIWSSRQEVVDRTTARRIARTTDRRAKDLNLGWIYVEEKEEVVFTGSLRYSARPIGEKLGVVCRLGDPQEIRIFPNSTGKRLEKWIYWREGIIVTFENDTLIKEDRSSVPAIPGYLGR